jgi:methyl-accepting chemotaxis protein
LKISVRMTLALLVAALLPVIIVGLWSLLTLQRASQQAAEQSELALNSLGQASIEQEAKAVAREIEIYLSSHPQVDVNDASSLEADADLAQIAVQGYGQEGYTAVFDQGSITHFHPNPALIGQPMSDLADQLPQFWAILSASLDGTPAAGYYDWQDPDGRIRRKYMSIAPVGDTPLRVASTTYIDEFSLPANQIREGLAQVRNNAQVQLLMILATIAVVTAGGAYVLGRRYSRPITQLVDIGAQIASGDLTVEPPATDLGELGELAGTFRQMTGNLSALIRRVQSMSMSLTSATEQVAMTHRQHTVHSDEQAVAVANASSAVEELASSSVQIAETAQQVVDAASQTQANARQGVQAMNDTAQRLQHIAAGNQDAVAKVRTLGNLAREIGMVMDLIEDIATQTRLIAFNASIEAAAAGAVGRRFAVVAGEVRRLASDVALSTEEIRAKVERIQTTTNELVIASERESKEIAAGQALGFTMAGLLDEIHQSAQHTTQAAQQISFGTRQQHSATEHLLLDLQSLVADAQAVAASSKETVTVMENLVGIAQDVDQAIKHFRLADGTAGLVAAGAADGSTALGPSPARVVGQDEVTAEQISS